MTASEEYYYRGATYKVNDCGDYEKDNRKWQKEGHRWGTYLNDTRNLSVSFKRRRKSPRKGRPLKSKRIRDGKERL